MNVKIAVFAPLLSITLLASSAEAQDKPLSLTKLVDEITKSYLNLDGKEITIDGAIGTLFGDILYFADETGRYAIQLDAGREVRRQIEGCELEMFDPSKSLCKLTGTAEVAIDKSDDDIGDGLEIELILFKVDSFSKRQ